MLICHVAVDFPVFVAYNKNIKKYCDKRLAFDQVIYKLSKQPSLGRVAVVAFYNYCNGVFTDM